MKCGSSECLKLYIEWSGYRTFDLSDAYVLVTSIQMVKVTWLLRPFEYWTKILISDVFYLIFWLLLQYSDDPSEKLDHLNTGQRSTCWINTGQVRYLDEHCSLKHCYTIIEQQVKIIVCQGAVLRGLNVTIHSTLYIEGWLSHFFCRFVNMERTVADKEMPKINSATAKVRIMH